MSFLWHFFLLIALVAYGEPTPSNYYMHDVVRPDGAFFGDSWQKHYETRYPPFGGFLLPYTFLVSKRSLRFFLGFIYLDAEVLVGPAIPALVLPPILLVSVLSFSMLVDGCAGIFCSFSYCC